MKKNIIIIILTILVIATTIFFILNIQNDKVVNKNISGNETLLTNEVVTDNEIDSEDENIIANSDKNNPENKIENDITKNELIVENTTDNNITNDVMIENQVSKNEEKTIEKEQEDIEPEVEYIQGIEVTGYIKIPKYNVESPIFKNVSQKALNISVAVAYGNLNEAGNTTIFGHAYENYPFEKISKLDSGDTIIITDATKKEITYEVYNKQVVNNNDASYMIKNTNGAKEITLQTGDTQTTKLIVSAKEIN